MKITDNILIKVEETDIKNGTFVVPDSVTSIGVCAFEGCKNLAEITIPNSVTSIDWNAFEGCKNLAEITIPNSVTSIDWNAFDGCTSLTEVTIPNSVTSIGYRAFEGCISLTEITIPDSVTSIGEGAFWGCTSLKEITIPNSVTSIGDRAFEGCTSLKEITIPDSVTSIGESAFWGCTNLGSKKANYKAFSLRNNRLFCKNYEFEKNKWSEEKENIKLCKKGYHYCINLFEIFNYYFDEIDSDIAIYECEVGNEVVKSETSKCVTNKIKPVKRLYKEDVIKILNGDN